MCSNGKCCGCINVETGSLIFGVISAVKWALTIVGSIIALIVVNVVYKRPYFQAKAGDFEINSYNGNDLQTRYGNYAISTGSSTEMYTDPNVVINAVCGSLLAVGLFNFFFSVLLCNGVNKRNVAQIKAYFIYGVVMTVLISIVVLIAAALVNAILILFIPLVIYGLILHMINMTIKKFSSGAVYGFNHKRLVETQSLQLSA